MKNSFSFLHARHLIILIGFLGLTLTGAAARGQASHNTLAWPVNGPVTLGRLPEGGPLDLLHLYGSITAADNSCTVHADYCDPALRISFAPSTGVEQGGTLSIGADHPSLRTSLGTAGDFILCGDWTSQDVIITSLNAGLNLVQSPPNPTSFNRTAGAIRFATTPQGTLNTNTSPGDIERMNISSVTNSGINNGLVDIHGDIQMDGDDGGVTGRPGRSIFTGNTGQKLNLYSNSNYANSWDWIEMFGGYGGAREGELGLCGNYVRIFSGNNATGNWGTAPPNDMEIALTVAANHNVGIGTNYSTSYNENYSPANRLEVNGTGNPNAFAVGTDLNTITTGFREFSVICATGTSDGGAEASGGGYVVVGAIPSSLSGLPATTTTAGMKLLVNGSMVAKEIWTSTSWSDYVFNDDYHLMPLDELAKLVKSTKHLPEMPTADEVAKQGISVGDVESKLLKKVEELTLYVVQLHDENVKLRSDLDKLSKQKQ